ncbi:sugar phosphate isomerase/epimerase [bacterium]|nr:sugar phosphate isomerase/epimerase [bacterium]
MKYEKFLSSTVNFHDFAGVVKLANELNVGIEISRFGKLSELDLNYKKTLQEYKNILADFEGPLTLHGFFSNLNVASKDTAIKQISIKRYYQSLEIAQTLGCKNIVFHTCRNNLLKHREFNNLYFKSNVEFFKGFIKEFEQEGITATIENVHEPNPEFIRDLLGAINSPNLKATLDIGHANLHGEIPIEDWIKTYGIMLHHMHLHNNFKDEDSHSSMLNGNIDFKPIFNTIETLNIKPLIVFEIFDEKSLRESLKYFSENFEN